VEGEQILSAARPQQQVETLCWTKKVVVFSSARCLHPYTASLPNQPSPRYLAQELYESFRRAWRRSDWEGGVLVWSVHRWLRDVQVGVRAWAPRNSSPCSDGKTATSPARWDGWWEKSNLGFGLRSWRILRWWLMTATNRGKSSLQSWPRKNNCPKPIPSKSPTRTRAAYLKAWHATGVLRAPARICRAEANTDLSHPFRWLPVTCP